MSVKIWLVKHFSLIFRTPVPGGQHQPDYPAIQYPSGTRLELYSSFQNLSSSYAQLLKSLTD
ncbi:MAG: hypothetical protein RIC53_16545 [Cyclobacteriaceae bacterium]